MIKRCCLGVLVLAASGLAVRADDDPYGDPLPLGAKTRLGTIRYRYRGGDTPVVMSDGKTILANDGWGLHRYNLAGVALGPMPVGSPNNMPLTFSADGSRAVSAYGSVQVWDLASGKTLLTLKRGAHFFDRNLPLADLSGNGKVLVLGAVKRDKEPVDVLVWDVDGNKEITRFVPPQNEQALVVVSPDGKLVATWGKYSGPPGKTDPENNPGHEVNFWDATTGKPLGKVRAIGFGPSNVVFSPDSTLAAVAGTSAIDLVDPKSGASKQTLLGRSGMGRSLTFSPDGTTFFAANHAGAVQRWRTADGERLSTTEPPAPSLHNGAVRPTSADRGIAWAMQSSALVVWEVPSGKLLGPQTGHSSTIQRLTVTPDSKYVLTSGYDGQLKWELATGKLIGPAPGMPWPGRFNTTSTLVEYAPGGGRVLVNDGSGFGVHDGTTGLQQFVLPVAAYAVRKAAFTADGTKVITTDGRADGKGTATASLWDVLAAKRLLLLSFPNCAAPDAALTPDGKHLVTVCRKPAEKGPGEFLIQTWEMPAGVKKQTFSEPAGYASGRVACAGDNRTAAVVNSKGQLVRFDLTTGTATPIATNLDNLHADPIFSPDGKLLAVLGQASFGRPAPVLVYDWAMGKQRHNFACPDGGPVCAAFSPDSRYLITGNNQATALVWELGK
jgi:WD40 repeat protein